ncbi:MAG: NADH-quinone oxidoreductase subunit NuoE [Myxococcota bacterium]|jgi:NADH-quinone oxidoreductase subunit E|nr:NADH-quinone oxidoreductase subunit NuoE [Myxococcota bacterium]
MVISAETRAAIDAQIQKYPQRRGALLPALHLVQKEKGWIAPETARELAAIFEIQPIEVLEVVTFYNMFYDRPQGRHHVYVCTNLPCSLRGGRDLVHAIEQHLGIEAGETTKDGRITLGHEECLGACAWAPMLRIGETYHENLDVETAKRLLDELK